MLPRLFQQQDLFSADMDNMPASLVIWELFFRLG
jgi:hypothetical protein